MQVITAHRNAAHWPFSTEKPDTDQENGRKLTFFFVAEETDAASDFS